MTAAHTILIMEEEERNRAYREADVSRTYARRSDVQPRMTAIYRKVSAVKGGSMRKWRRRRSNKTWLRVKTVTLSENYQT